MLYVGFSGVVVTPTLRVCVVPGVDASESPAKYVRAIGASGGVLVLVRPPMVNVGSCATVTVVVVEADSPEEPVTVIVAVSTPLAGLEGRPPATFSPMIVMVKI